MDKIELLIHYLCNNSFDDDRDEIKIMLENELQKPFDQIDHTFIQECIVVLSEIEGIALPVESELLQTPPPLPKKPSLIRKKGFKVSLMVAIVTILTICATVFVSAKIFHFDIIHYFIEVFSDHITVDYGANIQQADKYLESITEIRKELEVNGISPVLLPDKSMMDYSIKKIEYQNTEISKTAHIFLEKNEDEIIIDIIQYISSDLLGPGSHEGRVIESKEVFTNGIYILVLDFGSRRSLSYTEKNTEYQLSTTIDMESAIRLAESIE